MTHADLARAALADAASELAARRAIDRWLGAVSGRRLEIVGGQFVAWDRGWRCGDAATPAELLRLLDGEREYLRRHRRYCAGQRELAALAALALESREWQDELARTEARLDVLEREAYGLTPARETDALVESGEDLESTGEETE